jgi:3-deoxy-D-manno-octulosonic-acid transferase
VVRLAYGAAVGLVEAAAALAPSGESKIARSLRARRGLIDRVQAQARAVRDGSRPLIWFHAPSVGEGLQARPVAHAWRAAHPSWQQAYTFFSPSAASFASTVGAEICDYLPFDSVRNADAMLDALSPALLVFAKLDVWPTLVARAHARGVPVALISATLAADSGRRGWWSQQLVHDAYAALAAVGTIDDAHAARLQDLGVSARAIQRTGDTRFDQVAARAQSVNRDSALLTRLRSSRPTLVAGSTWPADEAVLLPAWSTVIANGVRARLIIAPHEPTPAHCAPIESWAAAQGLRVSRLSAVEQAPAIDVEPDVILVDRVGVLGELYALADCAFVGGGFHRAGLHSVIEPAAFGVPVAFGPGHQMSREAGELLHAGAARAVATATELAATLTTWLNDERTRTEVGNAARAVVHRELGATARSVALLERLVPSRSAL